MKNTATTGSLGKAKRLFRTKKYGEVIRMLEPEIFKYRESIAYYKLLGISCVYTDDVGGATSYLSRALQLDKDDVDSLLGLAVVSLKRMKTDEAIKNWLSVLEVQPKNRQANLGLELIRNKLEPEKLVDFVESGRIRSVYPYWKSSKTVPVIFLFMVVALAVLVPLAITTIVSNKPQKTVRPEFDSFALPANDKELTVVQGDFRYLLSDQEVRKTFNLAKGYFLDYRDNLALVEINRLLNSNALQAVKNTALAMKEHTYKPDFSTIRDSFPMVRVASDPYLYEGCYVRWIGRAGSVSIEKTLISFVLWVGTDKEFEGVVPVAIDFPFELANGQSIEVLGRIRLDQGKMSLYGIAIHRIISSSTG